MQAFFSHADLSRWWDAERSVAVARPSGPFAVSWPDAATADEALGPPAGTLHGTVVDYRTDRALVVADVYWQPPTGGALGPMALEITCEPTFNPTHTRVAVRQSASDDGPRWRRYFDLSQSHWTGALAALKDYIEHERRSLGTPCEQGRP
jgi:hypothetical protein